MNKILTIFLYLVLIVSISSCGAIKEGFSNQKKGGSDEFLVEKKSPLVMPPNFNELPIPKESSEDEKQTSTIKKLISEENEVEDEILNNNSNLEQTLLKKIKDN